MPETTRSWKRQAKMFFYWLWGVWPCQPLNFELLATREEISVVLNYPVCGTLLWQPQETGTTFIYQLLASQGLPSTATWRRQWQPTPVLLLGKSHGRRSLLDCSPWGLDESDTTERLHFHFSSFMHWRRKWQPTPVLLPGESQGWGSLVGCRLWGRTESDTIEVT